MVQKEMALFEVEESEHMELVLADLSKTAPVDDLGQALPDPFDAAWVCAGEYPLYGFALSEYL